MLTRIMNNAHGIYIAVVRASRIPARRARLFLIARKLHHFETRKREQFVKTSVRTGLQEETRSTIRNCSLCAVLSGSPAGFTINTDRRRRRFAVSRDLRPRELKISWFVDLLLPRLPIGSRQRQFLPTKINDRVRDTRARYSHARRH